MSKDTTKPPVAVSPASVAASVAAEVAKPAAPPEPVLPSYRVTWGGDSDVVQASSDREAWALFCDARKRWPPPKTGKVELLK